MEQDVATQSHVSRAHDDRWLRSHNDVWLKEQRRSQRRPPPGSHPAPGHRTSSPQGIGAGGLGDSGPLPHVSELCSEASENYRITCSESCKSKNLYTYAEKEDSKETHQTIGSGFH